MKTYYASGTVGDAYVILCKLYSVAKKEKILCRHRTRYEGLRSTIKDVYSLIPNIGVEFIKARSSDVELIGAFHYQGKEREKNRYNLKPEYYPEFESGDISHFRLPEAYEILQIRAGSHGSRSLLPEAINRILNGSRLPVVLIGENSTGFPTGNSNAVDLRGKTSIKEVVGIIKESIHFYGLLGFLSFVAVSHKIKSDVYLKSQLDISAIKIRIEAVEEWRRFLIRR